MNKMKYILMLPQSGNDIEDLIKKEKELTYSYKQEFYLLCFNLIRINLLNKMSAINPFLFHF